MARAETVNLYAAGSLKAALSDVSHAFERTGAAKINTTFGASGLLREQIEKGEPAHVFASADMKHPKTLEKLDRGGPVRMFVRNKLCAIAQPGLVVSAATLLDVLLDPKIRLGTSTPKADPSGDYAWELFANAEKLRPGALKTLDAKALKLTGGRATEKAPEGCNQYGWVMEQKKTDVFLTYCTNAVLAKKEVPDLQIVTVPTPLTVGAEYGLIVLAGGPAAAESLARHILGAEGQKILAGYGFEPAAGNAD